MGSKCIENKQFYTNLIYNTASVVNVCKCPHPFTSIEHPLLTFSSLRFADWKGDNENGRCSLLALSRPRIGVHVLQALAHAVFDALASAVVMEREFCTADMFIARKRGGLDPPT